LGHEKSWVGGNIKLYYIYRKSYIILCVDIIIIIGIIIIIIIDFKIRRIYEKIFI